MWFRKYYGPIKHGRNILGYDRWGTSDVVDFSKSGLLNSLQRTVADKHLESISRDAQTDAMNYIQKFGGGIGEFHGRSGTINTIGLASEIALRGAIGQFSMSWEYDCSVCSTGKSVKDATFQCDFKFEMTDVYDFAGPRWQDDLINFVLGTGGDGWGGIPYWTIAKWNGSGGGKVIKGITKKRFNQFLGGRINDYFYY